MWGKVLIVSDDLMLSSTRTALLSRWQTTTSTSMDALGVIRSTAPDLLILCQTVPDQRAKSLIESARTLNPKIKVLAVCQYLQSRDLDAERYEVQLDDPGAFAVIVADLLSASGSMTSR